MKIKKIHEVWKKEIPTVLYNYLENQKNTINQYEYRHFSQNCEDGIIDYLFSEIGFHSKFFLEFGFDVTENNCLRLLLKEKFSGVYIDGSDKKCDLFNKATKAFGLKDVIAISKFLKIENLESTIMKAGIPDEIDIISIDVDGNDYWFWEEINSITPRIVVIEYNASLGPELSLTVPYDPHFNRHEKHSSGFYCGASIAALKVLGEKKNYRLVGCDLSGVNSFFIHKDIYAPNIKTLKPKEAYKPHRYRLERGFSLKKQYDLIKDLPFIEVS